MYRGAFFLTPSPLHLLPTFFSCFHIFLLSYTFLTFNYTIFFSDCTGFLSLLCASPGRFSISSHLFYLHTSLFPAFFAPIAMCHPLFPPYFPRPSAPFRLSASSHFSFCYYFSSLIPLTFCSSHFISLLFFSTSSCAFPFSHFSFVIATVPYFPCTFSSSHFPVPSSYYKFLSCSFPLPTKLQHF